MPVSVKTVRYWHQRRMRLYCRRIRLRRQQKRLAQFHITANDIASSGAELVGILLTIIMPPNSEEGELKQIMDDVSQLTAEYHVEILGGHTEVSAVVNQTLVSGTGIGRIAKD